MELIQDSNTTLNKNVQTLITYYLNSFKFLQTGQFEECEKCSAYIEKNKCNHDWGDERSNPDCVFCCFRLKLDSMNK